MVFSVYYTQPSVPLRVTNSLFIHVAFSALILLAGQQAKHPDACKNFVSINPWHFDAVNWVTGRVSGL